jgi:RNA polymerase sigma-70 factor (ECF subfamily)
MTEPTLKMTEAERLDEDLLIKRSQSDPEAFKPLYEKYFKKIFLFIFHRTGDKELTGDLTQQAFLKALNGISKFQLRGLPFSAWLYRIAINECYDFFRKSKRARVVLLDEAITENLFEELTADNQIDELTRRLPEILQKLKPADLQLIEFRFFEGRSFREIGMLLEITEIHAKVKTYRALDKMKILFHLKK